MEPRITEARTTEVFGSDSVQPFLAAFSMAHWPPVGRGKTEGEHGRVTAKGIGDCLYGDTNRLGFRQTQHLTVALPVFVEGIDGAVFLEVLLRWCEPNNASVAW